MRRWIYDLGFLAFGIFSLPHFLMRLRQAEDPKRLLRERFGFFSPEGVSRFRGKRSLWIHSVSVGEAFAAEPLIRLLLERSPELHLIVTTVTPTGQRIAKRWEGERVSVFYFPFDLRSSVWRFFETFRPAALLLVETEIWPNVIEEARLRKVPVGVVNGRISERSFRGFRLFSMIFVPLLQSLDFLLVQTAEDGRRFLDLGVPPERLQVTGNMKFDTLDLNGLWKKERDILREAWGLRPSDQLLVGGSTHPGEEKILLNVTKRLRDEGFPLKLLLAPRHIERSEKIFKEAQRKGFRVELARRGGPLFSSFDVLILDEMGELRRLYAMAEVVFMGGSLVRRGGQNPIEPASSARAILHGNFVFNFREIYQRLDEEKASLRVNGEEELLFALKRLLSSERERAQLGNLALEILESLRGATERNLEWILKTTSV